MQPRKRICLTIAAFSFLTGVTIASQLDVVRSSEGVFRLNAFQIGSGDGTKLSGIYDCGPLADCAIFPVVFDRLTSRITDSPLDRISDFSFDGQSVVGKKYQFGPAVWGLGEKQATAVGNPRHSTSEFFDVAHGVSADGSVIVGQFDGRPFIWTAENGRRKIDGISSWSSAVGVANDGETVAGWADIDNRNHAFVWNEKTGVEFIDLLPGFDSAEAVDISADGSTIIGVTHQIVGNVRQPHGFRWTRETGMVDLGSFEPTRVNGDGSLMIGYSDGESQIWKNGETTSFQQLIRDETGSDLNWAHATDISDDGKTIVGSVIDNPFWSSGVILRIGDFDDCDLNADGSCDVIDIDTLRRHGIFRSAFDLDKDGELGVFDRVIWVNDRMNTTFGDADLDGQFDSGDLTLVFQSGRYDLEASDQTGWKEGDWNGDFRFDSSDLTMAFQGGNYESRDNGAIGLPADANVPEPQTVCWSVLGMLSLFMSRRSEYRTRSC